MWFLLLACLRNPSKNFDVGLVLPSPVDWSGDGLLQSLHIRESAHNPLAALVDVTVEGQALVTLAWDCDGKVGSQSQIVVESGTLSLVGVRAETRCQIQVDAENTEGRRASVNTLAWTSGALPADIPLMSLLQSQSDRLQPGTTLLRGQVDKDGSGSLYAVGVDTEGEVVWLYLLEDPNLIHKEHYVRVLEDGNLMLMLLQKARIINPAGETLYEIGLPELGDTHHDMLPLPNGDMLFLTSKVRVIEDGTVKIKGDQLVRVTPDNTQVWRWSAFDHLDVRRFPGPLSQQFAMGTSALDWTHGNALVLADPEGSAILYSSRNQSWIVKISLETGEIEWIFGKDGDFDLSAGSWPYNQHAPELEADGSLLMYDNGNERPSGPSTRVVRFELDQQKHVAIEKWSWNAPVYTDRVGDANLLENGNILVTLGGPLKGRPEVVELSPSGEVLWELKMDAGQIYRAERAPW